MIVRSKPLQNLGLAILVNLLFIGSAWSQPETKAEELKRKVYESKVKKSPAKELIMETDKQIDFFESQKSYGANSNIFKLEKSIASFELVKANKIKILEIDAKWKPKKIDNFLSENESFYQTILEKRKVGEEIKGRFYSIENFLVSKRDHLKSSRKEGGKQFYNFATGSDKNSLQWNEVKAKIEEGKKVEIEYKEYLKKKGENVKHFNGIKGIEYFTNGFRLLMEVSDFVKDNDGYSESNPLKYDDAKKLKYYMGSKEDLYIVKAYIYLYPDNEKLTALKKQIITYHDKLDAHFDKLATSPFHKEHFGEFLLSDHLVKVGSESEKDFKTSFKVGEPIYVTYYGLDNYVKNDAMEFSLFKGETFIGNDAPFIIIKNDITTSVFQFALIPKLNDASVSNRDKIGISGLIANLKDLNASVHSMTLKKESYTNKYSLEFELDVTSGNEPYSALLSDVNKAIKNTVRPPKPGMTSGEVTSLVKKAFALDDESHNVIRTIVVSKEWIIRKHELTGVIKNRELPFIAVICKGEKGCYLLMCSLFQSRAEGKYLNPSVSLQKTYPFMGDKFSFKMNEDYKLYFICSNQ